MHGQTIGALRVYRFTPDTPKASKVTAMNLQKLWELTGSQGDKWHKAQVMIPKLVRAHKVSLRIRSDFAAVYFVFRISYFVCHQHFLFSLFSFLFSCRSSLRPWWEAVILGTLQSMTSPLLQVHVVRRKSNINPVKR